MRTRTVAGTAILVIAFLLGVGNGIASAAFTVYHGYFTAASPHEVNAAAVAEFKSEIAKIDSFAIDTTAGYAPQALSIWYGGSYTPSGEADWQHGGAFYVTTAIYNLPANYSVTVDNNSFYDADGGRNSFISYWDQAAYTVTGPSLVSITGDKIVNWVRYSEDNGDGTYDLFLTSGLFDEARDGNTAASFDFQLQRTVQVRNGEGEVVYSFDSVNTASAVPLPGAIGLMFPGLVALVSLRKRFKA